jgi:hypothetical protein
MTMTATLEALHQRVDMELVGPASPYARELAGFVRYCVFRIERNLGAADHWSVTIAPDRAGYLATVRVHDLVRTEGGRDASLAAWSAMCWIEEALRGARSR